MPILYYIHDPMCSWCWGFRPTWEALKTMLAERVCISYVAGGLAEDCDKPMPAALQEAIQQHWRMIQLQLDIPFNFDFWTQNTPRRSTYTSCRAAIAAGYQGRQEAMIEAIQIGYYLRALNPSDLSVLILLSAQIGLNTVQFEKDLHSSQVAAEFERQRQFANKLPISDFPSLALQVGNTPYEIAIDYKRPARMFADISKKLNCNKAI